MASSAALAAGGPGLRVTVAEIVPEIIEWARGPMAEVTAGCLDDPRVRIEIADVGAVIGTANAAFDTILLDVDNGPDGVVRGSGIFASGWGAQRAAVYGVPEEELGAFYARRTLLKREVLPEHVAAAVLALCAGDLPLTTGLLIPVDAGVAAAFLR